MAVSTSNRATSNGIDKSIGVGRGIDVSRGPIQSELKRAPPLVSRERSLVATVLDQSASEKAREIAASAIRAMINDGTFFTAPMEPLLMSIVKADPQALPEAAQLQVLLARNSSTCAPATMVLITSPDQAVRYTTIERVLKEAHSYELEKKVLVSDRMFEHRALVARETALEQTMEFIANLGYSEKEMLLISELLKNTRLTDRVKVILMPKLLGKAIGSMLSGRK